MSISLYRESDASFREESNAHTNKIFIYSMQTDHVCPHGGTVHAKFVYNECGLFTMSIGGEERLELWHIDWKRWYIVVDIVQSDENDTSYKLLADSKVVVRTHSLRRLWRVLRYVSISTDQ